MYLKNSKIIVIKIGSSLLIDFNKKEIIVLNKTDLLDDGEVKKIMINFSKNKRSEVVTLSTLEKASVSKIKAKLLSYVS